MCIRLPLCFLFFLVSFFVDLIILEVLKNNNAEGELENRSLGQQGRRQSAFVQARMYFAGIWRCNLALGEGG